jgi:hypothetical protein
MLVTWRSTGHQGHHVALTRREAVERVVDPLASDHLGDDLRIEDGASGRHAAHCLAEGSHVADAVLEQVTSAGGVVADQLQRVAILEVLRQHEDTGAGKLVPDAQRRPQSVVAVLRWHLDVGHHHVRFVAPGFAHQVIRVTGDADHLEAGVLEHPDDPFAHEELVFADHDAQRALVGVHDPTLRR